MPYTLVEHLTLFVIIRRKDLTVVFLCLGPVGGSTMRRTRFEENTGYAWSQGMFPGLRFLATIVFTAST